MKSLVSGQQRVHARVSETPTVSWARTQARTGKGKRWAAGAGCLLLSGASGGGGPRLPGSE